MLSKNHGIKAIRDREMPYLVAQGHQANENVTANCIIPLCCGTSFSAPIVNGIAANLRSVNAEMWLWPEKVRATLLVTAQNVDYGEWDCNFDRRDGAGVVSGRNAELFASSCINIAPNYVYNSNASPVENGMGVITCNAGGSIAAMTFKIKTPSVLPVGKHLRVVLTWDSNARTTTLMDTYNSLSDFDLSLIVGPNIYTSASYNGSIEIVNVINDNYMLPNTTYSAVVSNPVNRIPTGDITYLCVAWTWVVNHAL